jgi:hypothetical protein
MAKEGCAHSWRMTNVRYGFIVVERCYHCKMERSYFAAEHTPPKEEYREGDHFWDYMGSAQSVQFGLKCDHCSLEVPFDDVLGLLTCSGCTPDCDAHVISRICEDQKVWVYVALCYQPDVVSKDDMGERLAVLSQYFNARLKTPGKKILIVPGWFVKDIDVCQGTVLKDVGMFEVEPQEAAS